MARKSQPEWDPQELGKALRVLRHRAGLKQSDVAARANASGRPLSAIYYRKCESGQSTPTYEKLETMVQALGSTPEELQTIMSDPLALEQGRHLTETRYRNRSLDTNSAAYQSLARSAPAQQKGWGDQVGGLRAAPAALSLSASIDSATTFSPQSDALMPTDASLSLVSDALASPPLAMNMIGSFDGSSPSTPQIEGEITNHASVYRRLSRGSQLALDSLYQHYAKSEGIE